MPLRSRLPQTGDSIQILGSTDLQACQLLVDARYLPSVSEPQSFEPACTSIRHSRVQIVIFQSMVSQAVSARRFKVGKNSSMLHLAFQQQCGDCHLLTDCGVTDLWAAILSTLMRLQSCTCIIDITCEWPRL